MQTARRNVLTHLPWPQSKALLQQIRQQFSMEKVNLSKVGSAGVSSLVIDMLHRGPQVTVAFYPKSCQQVDAELRLFAEMMSAPQTDRNDFTRVRISFQRRRQIPKPYFWRSHSSS